MNDDNMHKRIAKLSSVNITLPLHQDSLRKRLLAQHSSQHVSRSFMSTFAMTIKRGINSVKVAKKVTMFGAFASVVAIAAVIILASITPVTVSASQQISKTSAVVKEMSPQEKQVVDKLLGDQLSQRLAEAERAADLRSMSSKEFSQITNRDSGAISAKSYLTYTAPDSSKVIIAVDASDKPILLLTDTAGSWAAPAVALPPPPVEAETPPKPKKLH